MNIINNNTSNNILENMIIIGGSARSGTTIMGKLINSLQNTEYMFEPPMLISLLLKKGYLSRESLKELLQFYFFDNYLLDALAGRNINLNKNDDSCILNVKTEANIKKRYEKSYSRIELDNLIKATNFSFKLPEIVFFLKSLDELFIENKKVLMHRNSNDVINSILKKQWFSNKFLDSKHPSQIYAVEVIDGIKVPFWIEENKKRFWVESDELNRCAYYYIRISEEILNNKESAFIVDYDEFIQCPQKIFLNLTKKLNLEFGEKTEIILDSVKYQKKDRVDYISAINNYNVSKIINIENRLRDLCL